MSTAVTLHMFFVRIRRNLLTSDAIDVFLCIVNSNAYTNKLSTEHQSYLKSRKLDAFEEKKCHSPKKEWDNWCGERSPSTLIIISKKKKTVFSLISSNIRELDGEILAKGYLLTAWIPCGGSETQEKITS